MVEKCHAIVERHFSTGSYGKSSKKWSQNASLLQPGILRPKSRLRERHLYLAERLPRHLHLAGNLPRRPYPAERLPRGATAFGAAHGPRRATVARAAPGARHAVRAWSPCPPRRPLTPPAWGSPRDSSYPGGSSWSGSGLPCSRYRSARRRTPRPGNWAECRSHGRTSSRAPGAS